jgi:hypothetical protein
MVIACDATVKAKNMVLELKVLDNEEHIYYITLDDETARMLDEKEVLKHEK